MKKIVVSFVLMMMLACSGGSSLTNTHNFQVLGIEIDVPKKFEEVETVDFSKKIMKNYTAFAAESYTFVSKLKKEVPDLKILLDTDSLQSVILLTNAFSSEIKGNTEKELLELLTQSIDPKLISVSPESQNLEATTKTHNGNQYIKLKYKENEVLGSRYNTCYLITDSKRAVFAKSLSVKNEDFEDFIKNIRLK